MTYLRFLVSVIKWFKDYLWNRIFLVNVSDSFSNPGNLLPGVPQGFTLGPLLFLVYVNDLSRNLKSTVKRFADDVSLVSVVEDPIVSAN